MNRLDIATDALFQVMLMDKQIIVGNRCAVDIKGFLEETVDQTALSNDQFCERFWLAAKIVVNRLLEMARMPLLDEDGEEMHFLFLRWRFEFRAMMLLV